jgi:hypothetical protein
LLAVPVTITTADVNAASGNNYVCTIAGLTAHRNLIIPSGTAGDKLAAYIVDGDASFALIFKGAAGVTINSGSAATEWKRLFTAGDFVLFSCIAANTWIVEVQNISLCKMHLYLSTQTDLTQAVATYFLPTSESGVWTSASDVGGCGDTSTGKFTCRRAGEYLVAIGGRQQVAPAAGNFFTIAVHKNGAPGTVVVYAQTVAPAAAQLVQAMAKSLVLAEGDTLQFMARNQEANKGLSATPDIRDTFFEVTEVF